MNPQVFANTSFKDHRGELYSIYKQDGGKYVEDRISRSVYGTIRGFHGDAETSKLCCCLYGSLLLILWDIKRHKKYEYILSDSNKLQVLIPKYYLNAHQCISEECILLYKWDKFYSGPESQWSVNYKDSIIKAKWPIENPILSSRDTQSGSLYDLYESILDE